KAEGHHRHKKQTGGAGQFGEVYLRIEPLPQDHETGFEFVNATVGGSIPRQFMPAIEKGVRSVLSDGAVAGYPLTGVKVEVYDGKFHAVDSKEVAFVAAGKRAFVEAVKKARPVLLEPFVELEVTVPSDYMGDIAGDMSTKRGRVQDTEMLGSDVCVIRATAPLGEVQNYSNELKSMTGGSGSFVMSYSHDERTPPHVQQEVIDAFKPRDEED
ncbi:Translation elongation factor G-related protein, partial [hydrothermal vent metagenome]